MYEKECFLMKKILAACVAVVLFAVLVSCGMKENNGTTAGNTNGVVGSVASNVSTDVSSAVSEMSSDLSSAAADMTSDTTLTDTTATTAE